MGCNFRMTILTDFVAGERKAKANDSVRLSRASAIRYDGEMNRWFPLETERLLLREMRADDETAVHEYASDPEVVRLMIWGPNTREATREFLTRALAAQAQWPRTSVGLAIELKGERRLIGSIELRMSDEANRAADFG
jgi:RimJ/RimL family protein N-acetyltransferase